MSFAIEFTKKPQIQFFVMQKQQKSKLVIKKAHTIYLFLFFIMPEGILCIRKKMYAKVRMEYLIQQKVTFIHSWLQLLSYIQYYYQSMEDALNI